MTAPVLEEQEYIAGSPKSLLIALPEYTVDPAFCELGLVLTAPLALKDITTMGDTTIEVDGKIKPEKDEIYTFKVSARTPTLADDIDGTEWTFTLDFKFPKKAN